MRFLYPNVLWALVALTIPIIIHLFNFRRYKTVYFSNVAFLQNIRKETKSRSKLKNLLILTARVLALLFLILVFAQPYIPSQKDVLVSEKQIVAVYLDNSFSMDAEGKYGILLETAKVKARELTQVFPSDAKYLLLTNDFQLMHQRLVSSEQFVEWVSQIQSTHVVRKMEDVLDKFSGILPTSDSLTSCNVFLLSDFQKNTIGESLDITSAFYKLYAMPFINESEENIYIDSLWFETPGHYKGKQENIYVKIKNSSPEAYTEIPLQLYINDSLKSSTVFNVDAMGEQTLVLPFVQWNAGNLIGRVEISDYPITFDNTLFFNFEISEKKSVLIINGTKAEKYLEALFFNDENIHANQVLGSNIPFSTFSKYQTIILNEVENLSTGLINEVVEYTKQGGNLVFIPSVEGSLESYSMLFDNLARIKIDKFVSQEGVFSKIDFKNELFKSSFDVEPTNAKYPFYKGYYQFAMGQKANAKILFKTESNEPLFVSASLGYGQCYLSALPLNAKISDFGLNPLFVPLFYNIVLYASSPAELFYWLKPGLFNKLTRNPDSNGDLTMIDVKSGKEIKPKFNITHQNLTIFPEISTVAAGVHKLLLGVDVQSYISYNYDREESDISYYSKSEISELFNNTNQTNIELLDVNAKNLVRNIQQQSQGKQLLSLFLWLTIIMLVTEMLLLKFLR